jgi:predicted nucleic acid-binding protein
VPCEEIIIADSSPLIALARIGQLELLRRMARRIIVPRAVHAEVTAAKADAPGAADVAAQSWLEVRDADLAIVAPLLILIGRGEAEAIALAQREPTAVLLMDDMRARKLADRLGLRRMGTVALLGQAKREGAIPKARVVGNDLRRLVAHALSWVLNPLSHSETVERYRAEIEEAIFAVDDLQRAVREAITEQEVLIQVGRSTLIHLLKDHDSSELQPIEEAANK